jgi:hypothetical protein
MLILPKKYQRYRWFVILGLAFGFFLLLLFAYVVPMLFEVTNKKEQTDVLLLKNQTLRTKIQTLDSFVLADLEEKYQFASVGILQNKNPSLVLLMFDNLLSKIDPKNIDLGSISYSPGEVKEKQLMTDDLLFSQSVKGQTEKVNEFVNLIEKSFPIVSVRSIEGQYTGNLAMIMNFTLHIYPEVKQIPSIETPLSAFSPTELKLFDEIMPFASIFSSGKEGASTVQKSGKTNPFVE